MFFFPSFSLQSDVRGVRHWVRKGEFQYLHRPWMLTFRPLTTASTCLPTPPVCFTHSQHAAANSTAAAPQSTIKMRTKCPFPGMYWESLPRGNLFLRVTIFKIHQRPLKQPSDSIECDQTGYHNFKCLHLQTWIKLITKKIPRTLLWHQWIILTGTHGSSKLCIVRRMKKEYPSTLK